MDIDEAVRPCWMEIDLGALSHNASVLRSHLGPDIHVIAALKGDAYGHGIGPVARRLAECDVNSFATGSLRDAQAIRAAGVDVPILMFAGPLPDGMSALLQHGVTPTVHDWSSACAISRAADEPAEVYLKVDIGAGRLGVPVADALAFAHRMRELENIVLEGVYTHITFKNAAGRDRARECYAKFDGLLAKLAAEGIDVPITQALASGGLTAGLTSRANAVCPGMILYGLTPVDPDIAISTGYRPVVRAIKSRIIHISTPGAPARQGVVPIGMADGYRSHRPEAASHVLFNGRPLPITAVCLEYVLIDLDDALDADIGDEIVLLGAGGDEEIRLQDLATWQGCPPHEVLLGFEGRLRARYLD